VYSYGQRQGSVENDGASVHGPRPSEMRRGLGKARQFLNGTSAVPYYKNWTEIKYLQ